MPGSREEDSKETCSHTLQKNHCLLGHKSYNFGTPFLGHHYYMYILSFSDLCLGVEKIFKEIMHFHYMTTPLQKNSLPLSDSGYLYIFLSRINQTLPKASLGEWFQICSVKCHTRGNDGKKQQ